MNNICKNWSQWLNRTRFAHMSDLQKQQSLNWLLTVRNTIIKKAQIEPNQKIIDIGCGTGLLAFGVLEKFLNNVEIIFSDKFQDCLIECENLLTEMNVKHNASFLISDCLDIKLPSNNVDKALMRSVLVHILDKQSAINEVYRILKPGGDFVAFEPIISSNTKYWELTNKNDITDWEDFKNAENDFMSSANDSLTNFTQNTLAQNLENAGFSDGVVDVETTVSNYVVDENTLVNWITSKPAPTQPNVKERFLKYFDEKKVDNYISEFKNALMNKNVEIATNIVFIKATK